jgi:hypothetical protein
MEGPSRQRFAKLTSVSLFEQLLANGTFDSPRMPSPRLSIDTSLHSPAEAASQIAQTLQLPLPD